MDPNIKKFTRVGGWWMLFGLVFVVVGLLILYLFLTEPSPPGRATTGNVAILVGVLVLLLGAVLMSVRFGVIVDRQRRTVTTWWGPLVPFHKTERLFSASHQVTLSHEEREASEQSYEVFPVRLEGAGADAITLQELRDYDKARRLAEEIAKFLHFGIRDRSSGKEVVREAGALDESIRQRAKRLGLTSRMPQQPPGARSSVSFGENRSTVTIDIPPLAHWVWFVALGLISAGLCAVLIVRTDLPDMMGLLFAFLFAFLVLLCLFLPLSLFAAPRRQRLVVSPDGLVLTRRGIFGTNTTRLQADEIEEVEITPYMKSPLGGYVELRVVVIRSDRGSVELGPMRSEKELQWLRDILVHVLTSASP